MVQRYDFLLTAVELFKPEYFEDQTLVWFFQTIRDFYIKNEEQPTVDPVLTNELKKAIRAGSIKSHQIQDFGDIGKRLKVPVNSQPYVIDEVIRFCRRQAGRKIFLDSAPRMDTANDQDWDEIIDKVMSVSSIGANFLDVGTVWQASHRERSRLRLVGDDFLTKGATGINALDPLIGRGLRSGQLGVIMGGTGGGKSIFLPCIGKRAMIAGYNVAHYTLELNEMEVAARYDSAFNNIPFQDLAKSHITFNEKMSQYSHLGDRLIIKEYPTSTATVNTLRTHLRHMAGMDWHADLVVVDYGDLLRPLTNYDNEYADLGAIFRDLRGLAGEFKVPVWTATQTNRGGLGSDVVDIEHIGDSLKKAQIADVIIAMCANSEERQNNLMRLHLAKNRNGPSKVEVPIATDFSLMKIWDATRPQEVEEEPPNANPTGQVAAAKTQKKSSSKKGRGGRKPKQ